jgi:hypothetical protein
MDMELGVLMLRLTVLKNRVQRKIFGHKRDEIIGGWMRLYNEEL